MSSTARLPALVLVLGIALVAGCGSEARVPGQQAAAGTVEPTEARSIPEAFRGVWTSNLAASGQSHGAWKLRITAEDMELLNPRAESETQYFSMNPHAATPDTVTFADDPECAGASYHWTIDGDALTFAAIGTDPCSDRFDTLTGSAWQRSK